MAKNKAVVVARATVDEFERLFGQLNAFYKEISILSKKSPDGAVNKFKLRFINDPIRKATALLGEKYRPFPDFETFPEEEMPSASDVGMMLSQYLNSMERFKTAHTFKSEFDDIVYWNTSGGEAIPAIRDAD